MCMKKTMYICLSWCVLEVLKTTPSFGDLVGGVIDSAYSCSDGYDLLQQRDTEQMQHREKVLRAKTKGNQVQASKSPLPVASNRTCLTPPAMSYDNT